MSVNDLVIQDLAATEAALVERIASLEHDVASYRALAQAALGALRALTLQAARHRERNARLIDETRRLREALFDFDGKRSAA